MQKALKLTDFHYKTIHFIGIGGAGMIALAQYLRAYGKCKISGSDISQKAALNDLVCQGIKVFNTHSQSNIKQASLVVYSTAIDKDNVELQEAKQKKIPCIHRSEFLNLMMAQYERKITISGTHGKTTTTGMLIHILDVAGINPSFMIGGEIVPYNVNGRFSESTTFIAESDESDGSFLNLLPNFCIINNIEEEHLNHYKTKENLLNAFKKVIENVIDNNGVAIINADDKNINTLKKDLDTSQLFCFSLSDSTQRIYTKNIIYDKQTTTFDLFENKTYLDTITLNTLGTHNIYNALACISVCLAVGISITSIKKGLLNFKGVKRRLQLIAESNSTKIFDDYAHHPTEIKTTLSGIKKAYNSSIICIFQPHRYSRTQELLDSFCDCFEDADTLILTPIFAANEKETPKFKNLIDTLKKGINDSKKSPKDVQFLNSNEDIFNFINQCNLENTIIVTMGAGNINNVSIELKNVFSNGGVQNKKTLQLSKQ